MIPAIVPMGPSVLPAVASSTDTSILRLDASRSDYLVGGKWNDLAGNLDGTLIGGVSRGNLSKAFEFDGVDDYVDIPDLVNIDFSAGFSAHVVADFEAADNWERLLDFGTASMNHTFLFYRGSTGNDLYFEAYRNNASAGHCRAANGIIPGLHTYSAVVSSDGSCAIYRDGIAVTTSTTGDSRPTSGQVFSQNYLGKSLNAGDELFDGSIQSVIMYNSAKIVPDCVPEENSFTGNGTNGISGVSYKALAFTTVGPCVWTPTSGVRDVSYLVVAGGGGGGPGWDGVPGGGGGAGGLLTGATSLSAGTTDLVVGRGGAGGGNLATSNRDSGSQGGSSQLGSSIVAEGGGGGATARANGLSGGSGGGAGSRAISDGGRAGGLAVAGQGNNGGGNTSFRGAGGGGGAGGAGGTSPSTAAGSGGIGLSSQLTGSAQTYATGGAGGEYGAALGNGQRGQSTLGNGGAGGTDSANSIGPGGSGGSGIIVVRYTITPTAPSFTLSPSAGQVALSWSAPSHTGGSSITDYVVEYKPSGGSWTTFNEGVSSSTGATVTGLTNGTSYTFRVSSVNANGTGVASSESSAVTPRQTQTVTWSPTNTTVARSDNSVTLSPVASASGGTTITYSVASNSGPSCAIGNSATPTVTFSAVGTCVIRATAAEAGAYSTATTDITLTVGYKVTYLANATQHQSGVTAGSVPSSSVHAAGSTVTVSANSGSLTRQGFTLGGWNTLATGAGTNYAVGSGTFTISADTTLYAKWEIPKSARLIGLTGADAVSVVTATNEPVGKVSAMRGMTNNGSSVFFAPTTPSGVIRELSFSGAWIADRSISGFSSAEQRALAYSSGCIFYRGSSAGVAGGSDLWCIDTQTWTRHQITVPGAKPLEAGGPWLTGNLIDFPDGRIGAVSAPNLSLTVGTGAGQCPSGMYCKRLRLYTPSGTGQNVTLTFSEDIILADTESGWPADDRGISTDGTYLYQIQHVRGYKVWALRSGAPSYLVFNADGSGTCTADTGVSGSLCTITNGLSNATYISRDHTGKRYLVGDFGTGASGANKFFITPTATPPAGPGTPDAPGAPTGVTGTSGNGQVTVSWTAPTSVGGAPITGYTVTASPGGATCATASTSCVVTGLTNGTAYTFTVVATNVGGDSSPSTASSSVTPQKSSQTITFNSITSKVYGSSPFSLTVSASSGLSVSLVSTDTSVCAVSGTTVTIVSTGTCEIEADQVGDASYLAATTETRSFAVTPKPITMSVSISNKTYNGSSSASLSGTPTLTGVLAGDANYVAVDTARIQAEFDDPSAGTSKSVTVTLLTGTLKAGASGDRSARYSVSVSGTPTADIAQATQASLAITSANSMVFGQSIPLVAVGGSGSGALSYSQISGPCTVSGSQVTATGAGTCVVKATRAADTNYSAVNSSNFSITVSPANQTLNFTSSVPVSAVSGTTYTPAATSTSGLNATFAITTGDGTVCSLSLGVVTFAQSGTCVITATQGGNSNYNAATAVTQTIVAGKINQTISFPTIAGKNFSDPSFTAGASVSSGRSVTYQTTTSSVCSVGAATGVITINTVGDCTITASSAGDASYAAASDVSRTFRISPVVPGKPSITSVSFGNSSLTVAFTAPTYVGGDAIDGYEVVATSSGGTVAKPDCGTSSPCTITGLTNGENYTLTVAAVNAAGIGSASDASPTVTPATIPDAVSALTTAPGDEELTVNWSKATSFGGGSFTRYDVYLRVRGNNWGTPVPINNVNTETYTFTGLTNGTAYDVKVVTVSSANGSELSSNTATALGVPSTTPGAPTGLSVTALSNTTAVASWTMPIDDGGSAVSSYSVNLSCVFVNATDTVCELSGLTAGSTITVTVGASNLMGTGPTTSVSITMPGGSSGAGGGGGGVSNSNANRNTQNPATQNTPTLNPSRIIGPVQRPPSNPTVFTGPVQDPTRGFDPNAGFRAIIGGQPATVNRNQDANGNLSVQAGTLQLGVQVPSGNSGTNQNSTGPSGAPELTVPRGQAAEFRGSGLLPGSQLQIWLPGTGQAPRELARIPVNPDGSFQSQLSFTARQSESPLPIGRQVMQVTGYDENGNATIVDMTVNIAQGAPAPEPNRAINALPTLIPGESLATSGGLPEVVSITFEPTQGQVLINSGGWAFQIVLPEGNGQVSQSGTGGSVILVQSKTASVEGEGFQPNSRVDIWLFSDPTLLGTVSVGEDGSFDTEVFLDERFVVAGDHTLQLQGVGEDGFIKAANLGVTVEEDIPLTSQSASSLLLWVGGAFGLAIAVSIVLLATRRSRARKSLR